MLQTRREERIEPAKLILEQAMQSMAADGGSVFLLGEEGLALRGAPGLWDWTRSGFRAELGLWPTVRRAIVSRKVVSITAERARRLERDWFGPDGIASCICAPLVYADRVLGVMFLDYRGERSLPSDREIDLVQRFALKLAGTSPIPDRDRAAVSGIRARPGGGSVAEIMTCPPVVIDARVSVRIALRVASAAGARWVLAMHGGRLCGVVRESAMESVDPDVSVGEIARSPFPHVASHVSPDEAVRIMLETGAGCLPVLDESGELLGVVTRRDLRRAGFLPGSPGFDVCAACGSTGDLMPRGPDEDDVTVFCDACVGSRSWSDVYDTLGGSG